MGSLMIWLNLTQNCCAKLLSITKRARQSALSSWMQKKGRIRTGRSGEHYVCYLIEQSGLEAVRVDGITDLHITLRSGRVISVEVKTCTNARNGSYNFHRGRSSADVFAFVTLGETTLVRLFPEESAPKWTLSASEFTKGRQQQDLDWIVSLQ